jgi:hypothetical protein
MSSLEKQMNVIPKDRDGNMFIRKTALSFCFEVVRDAICDARQCCEGVSSQRIPDNDDAGSIPMGF